MPSSTGASDGSIASSILVVDDDADVRQLVAWRLEADGFDVIPVPDGRSALLWADDPRIGLVVLDLSLPDIGGLDVLRRIRSTSQLPVIILSGRCGETDRMLGLDMGADDYMVKPFSPGELSSRVRAVMRRTTAPPIGKLTYGSLVIDVDARVVTVAGAHVELAPREFDVLVFLARSPRRALSRTQILHHVWDSTQGWRDEATVTQHVHRLRHKIEENPDQPRWLRTVSRIGYRFEP